MLERLLVEQRLRVRRPQQRELAPRQLDPLLDELHVRSMPRRVEIRGCG